MPRKGARTPPEHKEKIAAAHRGMKRPWTAGERNPAKRPEVRAKISAALRGVSRPKGPEHWNWKGHRDPNEAKPCECRCGTPILRWKRGSRGRIQAVENRFAVGHQGRDRKRPDFAERVREMNRARIGDLNPASRPEVRAKISAAMTGRIPKRILRLMEAKALRAAETVLCECGCGTAIRKWRGGTSTRPNRFARGHHNKGRKRPVLAAWVKANARANADSRNHLKHEEHWNWKGGISEAEHLERGSPRYRAWRDAVYRRDNWMCVMCGRHCQQGNIAADHIVPWDEAPDLRYVVSNGRTLCRSDHARRHGLGGDVMIEEV